MRRYQANWRFAALAALAILSLPRVSEAVISGPYAADGNTLHLWHFNETAGATTVADSAAAPLALQGVLNGSTLGSPSFTGFGNASYLGVNALDTTVPVNRPILLAAPALDATDIDAVPFSFSSAPGAGAPGAFTMEALVKFDSTIFDPTSINFRNGAGGSVGGTAPMDIVMGEGDANGARNFQFKIDQIGTGIATTANGTSRMRIEFGNLHGITGLQQFAWDLPNAGPNAVNNADWFHVAVSYNGMEGVAGNLTAYWTKMVPTATTASSLGAPGSAATVMNQDLLDAFTAFSIGNEARTNGGEAESFPGLIDEVRISGVARAANQFFFVDPKPGDVNGDNVVDILDFNVITANLLNATAVRTDGDLNADGIVDFADFRIWKLNKTSPPGDVAIPEPAAGMLAAVGLAGLASVRRRSSG